MARPFRTSDGEARCSLEAMTSDTSEHPLLDEAYALRCRELRDSPGFVGPNATLRRAVSADLTAAAAGGEVAVHRASGGDLRGIGLKWSHVNPYMGRTQDRVVLSYEPHDEDAMAWALTYIQDRQEGLGTELLMTLFPHQDTIREQLLSHPDFGVDSLVLIGEVDAALRYLDSAMPETALDDEGLVSETFQDHHIEPTVALRRDLFRAQPAACWFGADDAHLPALRKALGAATAESHSLHLAWMKDSVLVAALGCKESDEALWGRSVGMDLVLAPTLQGRGLVKIAYRQLLRACSDIGIQRFYGCSSQPGVLTLGLRMSRQVGALCIRRATLREPDWFRPWLQRYAVQPRIVPVPCHAEP